MVKKKLKEEDEPEDEAGDEEPEEEEKTKKPNWNAQEVPTETAPMVVNIKDGKAYHQTAVLALILNKLEKLEDGLLGD